MKDRYRRGGKQDERLFALYHKATGLPLRDKQWLTIHFKGYTSAKDHRKSLSNPRDWKIVQVKS